MSKALHFLQITAKHQDCPFCTAFLTITTSSQNISITLLQILLKLYEHRGRYWRKKLPRTILEEQLPVSRYTAASKIGNSVISLLCQLRCRCNPDHNNFLSLSNTAVEAIFLNLCLWRRSSCSNLGVLTLKTVSSHLKTQFIVCHIKSSKTRTITKSVKLIYKNNKHIDNQIYIHIENVCL